MEISVLVDGFGSKGIAGSWCGKVWAVPAQLLTDIGS